MRHRNMLNQISDVTTTETTYGLVDKTIPREEKDQHHSGRTLPGPRTVALSWSMIQHKLIIVLGEEDESHSVMALVVQETVALSSSEIQHERIVANPNILGGEPHIRGTRIPIAVILDGFAEGLTPKELMEHYPSLIYEDIQAALEHTARTTLSSQELE
jgi:uncharacterized protein (DUF433 family)